MGIVDTTPPPLDDPSSRTGKTAAMSILSILSYLAPYLLVARSRSEGGECPAEDRSRTARARGSTSLDITARDSIRRADTDTEDVRDSVGLFGDELHLSWTSLVCQCIKHVSGVGSEVGLRGDLLSGEADGDVLKGSERADDLADAEPGLVL